MAAVAPATASMEVSAQTGRRPLLRDWGLKNYQSEFHMVPDSLRNYGKGPLIDLTLILVNTLGLFIAEPP